MIPVGALAGFGVACGILLISSSVLASRPSLMARVEPYVRASDAPLRPTQLADGDASLTARLLRPLAQDSARVLDHLGSSTASVRQRLRTLGSSQTPEAFRVEQLLWAVVGLTIGLVAALIIGSTRGGSPVALAALAAVCAVVGALARDRALSRAVKRREERIAAEFPTVAELLALAIGSGEAPTSALARVARSTHGDLAGELRLTLADVRAGATMSAALDGLARRSNLPAIARFADGVATAIERGSPLAEVLRAQAGDARDSAKRDLMEAGGRKEIGMLVPVVFFVLPLTVLFALFPGMSILNLS